MLAAAMQMSGTDVDEFLMTGARAEVEEVRVTNYNAIHCAGALLHNHNVQHMSIRYTWLRVVRAICRW